MEIKDLKRQYDTLLDETIKENGKLIKEYKVIEGQLVEVREELGVTKVKLADTEKKLADTEKKLADTKEELADTKEELADTKRKLTLTEVKLEITEQNFQEAKARAEKLEGVLDRLKELKKQIGSKEYELQKNRKKCREEADKLGEGDRKKGITLLPKEWGIERKKYLTELSQLREEEKGLLQLKTLLQSGALNGVLLGLNLSFSAHEAPPIHIYLKDNWAEEDPTLLAELNIPDDPTFLLQLTAEEAGYGIFPL
jgi:chromosome segregation ATPase